MVVVPIGTALSPEEVGELGHQLDAARTLYGTEVADGHVWHLALSNPVKGRQFSDPGPAHGRRLHPIGQGGVVPDLEHLRAEHVVRPGLDRLVRAVATARADAPDEVHRRLGPALGPERRAQLDALVDTDPELAPANTHWQGRFRETAAEVHALHWFTDEASAGASGASSTGARP